MADVFFYDFGFPKLSVIGAGIASSFSFIVTAVILFALAYQHVRKTGALEALVGGKAWWYFSPIEAKRLLYFGTPAGAQMAAESMSFSVIMLSVGSLGEYAMAATTLALGVNILAFVPMNGLGMALGVLVGQCLTAGKVKAAERGVRSAIIIAMIYTSFFVLAYGVFTDWTLSLYAFQMPPERFETIRPILRLLLRFIAAYCLFDAIQIVFVGAIKGAGDTFFVLIGSAIIGLSVVGLGFAGTFVFESSVYYWWAVISIWVLVMAIVFSSRFATGKWKTMRVIEADLTIAD
ncbi:MAG: MATE family efflux transporter [Bacteroidota bacterium]